MNNKKQTIIIIILGLLLFIAVSIIIFLITKKEPVLKEISGTIIITDKDYLMLETPEEDYIISNFKGSYNVGDTVKFYYKEKDLNTKNNPKVVNVSDEDLIKVASIDTNNENNSNKESNNEETKTDNNITSNNSNNTNNSVTPPATNNNESSQNNNNNSNSNTNTSNNNSSNKENNNQANNNPSQNESADTAVINYFNDYNSKIASTPKGSIASSVKSGFVTIIDFLFYDGTIKGYHFKDLTSSAKLKVLSMAMYFDNKIEEYFPGYKESISNTANKVYTNLKSKIVSVYLNLTTSICNSNLDLCASAKENFGELKKNFGLTWSLLKDIAGDGLSSLKNWYEIWRES